MIVFRAEFIGNSYVATIVLLLSGPPAWWDWLVLALRRWTLHPCCRWYKLGQLLEMERPAFQVLRIAFLTRGLHLPSFPSFTGLTPSSRSKPAPRRLVAEDSLPRPKSPAPAGRPSFFIASDGRWRRGQSGCFQPPPLATGANLSGSQVPSVYVNYSIQVLSSG